MPFQGLPVVWTIVLSAALVLILAMFGWSVLLLVRGRRARRNAPEARPGGDDDFLWVFLVPALDEEITISDSVERLLARLDQTFWEIPILIGAQQQVSQLPLHQTHHHDAGGQSMTSCS